MARLGLEKKKFKLIIETVSHVHIGSAEKKIPMIFYKDLGGKIARLKDEFVFSKVEDFRNVSGFFEKDVKDEAVLYVLDKSENIWGRGIRQFIRHPNGKAYIPASSVKGMLRLMVTYHLLKRDPQKIAEISSAIENAQKLSRKVSTLEIDNRKKLADVIDELLVSQVLRTRNRSNGDCFRALVIRDSSLLDFNLKLALVGVIRSKRGLMKFRTPTEMIPPGKRVELEGYVDLSLAKELECLDILDEVKEALNEVGREFRKIEEEFWKNAKVDQGVRSNILGKLQRANAHLGFGGSVQVKTIFNLLSPKAKERVLKAINDRKKNMSDYTSPYTRKVVLRRKDQILDVIGWVRVRVEDM